MPINLLAVVLLVLNIGIISIMTLHDFYELAIRSLTIEGYFVKHFLDFPTFKQFILGQSAHIIIPITIAAILGIYLVYVAHFQFKEKIIKHAGSVVTYFIFIPYFITINWITAIVKEIFKSKRKW